MRLPDFCNRLTTRAPNRLPDSRARSPSGLAALRSTPTRRRPMASSGSPGGASLDGEPPASASSQPPGRRVWGRGPKHPLGRAPRGPGGASIECSSALRLPAAALSTAHRACDVASGAPCRGPLRAAPALRPNPPGENRQARLPGRLVKDDRFVEPGRLPSTSALSPVPRLAPLSGIAGSPPPFSRLCRRDPASDALSPSEHEAGWLDPTPSTWFPAWRPAWTRRLSSTSATRTIHEHNRTTARSPARACRRVSPSSRWAGRQASGWG